MNPSYDFAGQVALVTGASSGLGLATAKTFAAAGAAVVLVDRNERQLAAAAGEITSAGGQSISVVADVADEAAAAVGRAVGEFGRLDTAYNNAGILGPMWLDRHLLTLLADGNSMGAMPGPFSRTA